MESEINKHLKQAEDICNEAYTAYCRASTLRDRSDYGGAIEASQHCIELSVKALYKLVDLEYPKKHDPAVQLEEVMKRLQPLPDHIKLVLARAKWISKMWEWAHNTAIYGSLDVPASRVFKKKDVDVAIDYASEMHSCCYVTIDLVRSGQIKVVR